MKALFQGAIKKVLTYLAMSVYRLVLKWLNILMHISTLDFSRCKAVKMQLGTHKRLKLSSNHFFFVSDSVEGLYALMFLLL